VVPCGSCLVPEPRCRLTIYSCTQAMYFSMGVVAAHLEWPLNKLKFVGGTVGGGFGGKVDTATETITALLALKANRPVKWRWTREEEFLCSSTRAPWHMELADAVTSDGWLLGRKMITLHDAGAYSRFSPYGLTKHSFHHTGAYTIPNLEFDGYVVYTNRTPTTAMRGFGVTSVSFATETHMSRIADVLGVDPIEIRLKNANRIGDPSQAWIKVKPDGRIDVFAGTADIGNGSKTIQSQIVAETIGVPYDWVTYDNSNTDSSPMCTGTFASRATFVAGMAALKAAQE